MALALVEGWSPPGSERAASDDPIFELLTAVVFQARFSLAALAVWPDCVANLMAAQAMVRHEKKIRATLRNARDLLARSRQCGSAGAYVQSFGNDADAMVRDIDTWAPTKSALPRSAGSCGRSPVWTGCERRAPASLRADTVRLFRCRYTIRSRTELDAGPWRGCLPAHRFNQNKMTLDNCPLRTWT